MNSILLNNLLLLLLATGSCALSGRVDELDIVKLDLGKVTVHRLEGPAHSTVYLLVPKANKVHRLSLGGVKIWDKGGTREIAQLLALTSDDRTMLQVKSSSKGDGVDYTNMVLFPRPTLHTTSTSRRAGTSSSSRSITGTGHPASHTGSSVTTSIQELTSDPPPTTTIFTTDGGTGTPTGSIDMYYLGFASFQRELSFSCIKLPTVDSHFLGTSGPEGKDLGPESRDEAIKMTLDIDSSIDRLYFNYSFRWRGNLIYQKWEPNDGEIFWEVRDKAGKIQEQSDAPLSTGQEDAVGITRVELFDKRLGKRGLKLTLSDDRINYYQLDEGQTTWVVKAASEMEREFPLGDLKPIDETAEGGADLLETLELDKTDPVYICRRSPYLLYHRTNLFPLKMLEIRPVLPIKASRLYYKVPIAPGSDSTLVSIDITTDANSRYLELVLRDKNGNVHSEGFVGSAGAESEWERMRGDEFFKGLDSMLPRSNIALSASLSPGQASGVGSTDPILVNSLVRGVTGESIMVSTDDFSESDEDEIPDFILPQEYWDSAELVGVAARPPDGTTTFTTRGSTTTSSSTEGTTTLTTTISTTSNSSTVTGNNGGAFAGPSVSSATVGDGVGLTHQTLGAVGSGLEEHVAWDSGSRFATGTPITAFTVAILSIALIY